MTKLCIASKWARPGDSHRVPVQGIGPPGNWSSSKVGMIWHRDLLEDHVEAEEGHLENDERKQAAAHGEET